MKKIAVTVLATIGIGMTLASQPGTADVFASADMGRPQALAVAGRSAPVVLFARNRLCAIARPEVKVR